MNSIDQQTDPNPYSAKHMAKPVNFYCAAPEAKSVHLEGDFSSWAPLPMQRRVDGWWFLQVQLTHGHHQYRFNIDGQRRLDPRSVGTAHNEANEEVSIVSVS
ncbi:MAG TPA: glycoside hydrolase family 13 [Verrucomicrobiae bacterium]|nr:glycoside hydrolase family 13 [Verrucomicrobiae bacterium]